MDKINLINYLIEDTKCELEKFEEYDKLLDEAKTSYQLAVDRGIASKWDSCYDRKYFKYNKPNPSKQKIKDNMKIVRRLCQEISQEILTEV